MNFAVIMNVVIKGVHCNENYHVGMMLFQHCLPKGKDLIHGLKFDVHVCF